MKMIKRFNLKPSKLKNPSSVSNKYICSKCNGSRIYQRNWECGHCCGTGFLGYFEKDKANISGLVFKKGEEYQTNFSFTRNVEKFIVQGFYWKNDKSILKAFVPVNQICMEIYLIGHGICISIEMPDFLGPGLWASDTNNVVKETSK